MASTVLGIIASFLLIVIGLWKHLSRKAKYKREQAEQAKKDLNNANKTDNPSDFLDGFGKIS